MKFKLGSFEFINVFVLLCFGIDIYLFIDKVEWEWGCLVWFSFGKWFSCVGIGYVGLVGLF